MVPPSEGTPAVEVRGLTKTYGEFVAVKDVSFEVAQGEIFAFLGPNGAGKSTTIKMLCTLARPTAGLGQGGRLRRRDGGPAGAPSHRARLPGADPRRPADRRGEPALPRRALRRALRPGRCAHHPGLEPGRPLGPAQGPRLDLLGRHGPAPRDRSGHAPHPTVLFLDEPTVGLDPQTRALIWEDIHRLRREEGITIFLTTHYMDEAENAERIAIIDHGEIIALDTPDALKASVGSDTVELETADDDCARSARCAIAGYQVERTEGGLTVYVEDEEAAVGRARGEPSACRCARCGPIARRSTTSSCTTRAARSANSTARLRCRCSPGRTAPADAEEVAMTVMTTRPPAGGRPTASPRWTCRRRPLRASSGSSAMVWERELIRYVRTRTRILSGLIQPVLFLFVLGYGMSGLVGTVGGFNFHQFVYPGVVAMSVVMTAMFSALSIVWDREFGFLREMLIAPVSRATLVLGKTFGGATVAAVQGTIMLVLAPLVGIHLTPLLVVQMIGLELLMAVAMTTFGVFVASRISKMESFQVVMQMLLMPMLFLSNSRTRPIMPESMSD